LRLAVLDSLEKEFPKREFRYLRGEALFLLDRAKESERVLSEYVSSLGQKEPYYPYKPHNPDNPMNQEGLLNFEVEPAWAWMMLARLFHKAGREEDQKKAFQNAFDSLNQARIPVEFREALQKDLEKERKSLETKK